MRRIKIGRIGAFFIGFLLIIGFAWGEVGVTDNEIKLGNFIALTGPAAVVGQPIAKGMKLYVDYINDKGGVYGRKINFICEDDNFMPSRAREAANKLIYKDKVFAIWQVMQGAGILAAEPIIMKNKVPTLVSTATDTILIPPRRYIFGWNMPYSDDGIIQIDWAVKKMGKKRIAVIAMWGPAGETNITGARARLKNYDMEPILEEKLKNVKMDYSGLVTKMRRLETDCVLITNTLQWTIPLLKEIQRQGWKPSIIIGKASGDISLLKKLAGDAADGAYVLMTNLPTDTDNPHMNEYREVLKKYGSGESPGYYHHIGYGTVQLFVSAIKQVGRDLTREKLIDTMESWKDFDTGWIGKITLSPTDHIGQEGLVIVKMVDGKAQVIEPFMYIKR
ncbi:ABC transporter substrate-binding protein [Thermodesulfobacteriota bacterium]